MSYIGNTVENQNYVPAIDYFNGDGSTVAFTLSRPVASVAAVQAVISNVPQNPGSAFTVSGSTITFTSAPPSGTANIYVYYTSPNTQVVQPGQGTVYPSSLSTGGPYWNTSGYLGIGTTSPQMPLHVYGTGDEIARIQGGLNHANGVEFYDGTSTVQMYGVGQELRITSGAGVNTVKATLDSTGRLLTPYQTYFTAFRQTDQTGYNASSLTTTIAYDLTTVNVGNNFSTATGLFTAPVAGKYIFASSTYTATSSLVQTWLVVNGARADATDWVYQTAYNFTMGFFLVYLNAGDSVGVHAYNGSVSSMTINANYNHTFFKGYLLG